MHQLLLATRNSHKTREFAEILGDEFEVHDLAEAVELPAVEETGRTFEANAILKAVETSKHFPGLVVADDSGLEVDALGGAPGIYSARYAGEHAADAANVAKLLGELRECDPGPADGALSLLAGPGAGRKAPRNIRRRSRRNNRGCASGRRRVRIRPCVSAARIRTDVRRASCR